jgi:hypothetical protein
MVSLIGGRDPLGCGQRLVMTQCGVTDVFLYVQARVLYCSATGASEPKNLAYMTRLGTFGHQNFKELLDALTGSGTNAVLQAINTTRDHMLSYNNPS